ncbi:MAG: hypothetical protein HYZ25_13030 [Chloroflexi bacterium]|nr:hypothetical protein [Chloroflexota bacterium]
MEESAVLELVARLAHVLADERIEYCHWKSNAYLDRSASGENDLDLLIGRSHGERFVGILLRLGFKETFAPHEAALPGVRDFYGYDMPTGRWVHVHAHFQLILGNDLSKNYRLPLEREYLASSSQGNLFRLPAPEFELLVLVIRMVLKHSTWDSILMRHGSLTKTERRELEVLSTEENLAKMGALLPLVPGLDRSLFDLCLRSLRPGCPPWTRVRAGERLQALLRAWARYPHTVDVLLKLIRRVTQPFARRVLRIRPKNRLVNGGLFVAVVGGDGAGKTTLIDAVNAWLSAKFKVKTFHMGKPAWSLTTVLLRGLLKVGTLLRLYSFEGDTYEQSAGPHGLPWFIRAVCTARDRSLTYQQARRFSSSGGLALCDRYSFPGFMHMDGPQCEGAVQSERVTGLRKFLIEQEKNFYQHIPPPDLLIVLKLDPEIAIQRKTEETALSVRARSTEVWGLDWDAVSGHIIDASRPRDEVLAQVQALLWEHL